MTAQTHVTNIINLFNETIDRKTVICKTVSSTVMTCGPIITVAQWLAAVATISINLGSNLNIVEVGTYRICAETLICFRSLLKLSNKNCVIIHDRVQDLYRSSTLSTLGDV
jgi:phospholipid N-methyltransferase